MPASFKPPMPLFDRVAGIAGTPPVLLGNLAWPFLSGLREANGGMVLLPLGATEQHGPHLPVSTDTLIAEACAWFASAMTGVPVLPALAITASAGHTAKWPGTFSVRHETLIAQLREIAAWAAATGWKRLLFVNAHFGNDAALRVAVDQIRNEHPGRLQTGFRHTYALTAEIREYFISDAADFHANKAETDLILHLAPHLVRRELIEDDPDRTKGGVFSRPVSQTSLNGVTGAPSQGTAERGAALFREMGEALAAVVLAGTTEDPPLDPRHWKDVPALAPSFLQPRPDGKVCN